MGGANGGNVASAIAVETIREQILAGFNENLSKPNIKNLMVNAISRANEAVHKASLEQPELRGMGTTVVLLIATKGTLHTAMWGQPGLSPPPGRAEPDHHGPLLCAGPGELWTNYPAEARIHPKRNIITRVLGVHEQVRCDYNAWDFSPGDVALACSDGLSNYMEDELLEEYLDKYGETGNILAKELIQYAIECGGADNITAAVIYNG
mgnify:CR=1 FL=1